MPTRSRIALALTQCLSALLCGCSLLCEQSFVDVIDNWGHGSSEHDSRVMDIVLKSVDGVNHYGMNELMLSSLVRKMRSNPLLLGQLFTRYRSNSGAIPPCDDDGWFVARLIDDMQTDAESRAEKAVYILLLASMFNRADWLTDLEWPLVEKKWVEISDWVSQHKYVAVYDHNLCKYVIDDSVILEKGRVPQSRQSWLDCTSSDRQ